MDADLVMRIIEGLEDEIETCDFSKWEEDFIRSMKDQLEQGRRPSEKQQNIIYRLKDKAGI